MSSSRKRAGGMMAMTGCVLALVAARVHAQPSPPSPAPNTPAPPPPVAAAPEPTTGAPLVVEVDSDAPYVDAGRVREAIASELHAPVVAAVPAEGGVLRGKMRVQWRDKSNTLLVHYEPTSGPPVERTVRSDPRAESIATVAALLAGNLARDEASELLGQLHPKKKPAQPPPAAPPPAPPEPKPEEGPYHPVTAAFFYPLATSFGHPDARSALDFSLLFGQVGHVDALSLSSGVSYLRNGATGAHVSALGAIIGAGGIRGAQAAGVLAYTGDGPVTGVQVAGVAAVAAKGPTTGAQAAGVAAFTGDGPFIGAQGAGVVSFAQDFTGAQVAGVVTVARKMTGVQGSGTIAVNESLRGMQAASFLNVTEKLQGGQLGVANWSQDTEGAQTGVVNVGGNVDGMQLGVVNVGRKVRGLQLGLVNVADEVDGAAIGLVSISKDGVHPIALATSTDFGAGFKFATKYMFTSVSVAIRQSQTGDTPGISYAIGGHVPISQKFYAEAQVMETSFSNASDNDGREIAYAKFHLIAGYRFAAHLGVFVGGGPAVRWRDRDKSLGNDVTVLPDVIAGVQF